MRIISDKLYREVKNTYLQVLEIPSQKANNQYIVCPIGLVGAGKTTVMKPLSKKLGLVRISGDEIRKLFNDRGCGYERVLELGEELISEVLESGHSVGIDSDCAGPEVQLKLKTRSASRRIKLVWIHINPPEQFIVNKLSNLNTNWLGSAEEMIRQYYLRKPFHKNLTMKFSYVFDTSRDDLEAQIDEAVGDISDIITK